MLLHYLFDYLSRNVLSLNLVSDSRLEIYSMLDLFVISVGDLNFNEASSLYSLIISHSF
jgi:hypothetical protein